MGASGSVSSLEPTVAAAPRGRVIEGAKCNTCHPGNCWGVVSECNSCEDTYCQYHYIGVKTSRTRGGHICSCPCSTANVMVQVNNCKGELSRCPHCHQWYCDYHFHANEKQSTLTGGHVCQVTQNDVGVLKELGRLNGAEQGFFNKMPWAPDARFADQVCEGARLYEEFSDMNCPPVLGDGIRVSTDDADFRYRGVEGSLEKEIVRIFGHRLAEQDLENMLRLSVKNKTVLVSMNWAFCNEANFEQRIELLERLRDDPNLQGYYFVIRNDQAGYDLMHNYRDEGSDVFYDAKNDEANRQKKWEAWFIALAVADYGICIHQTKGGRGIVSKNTAREFMAFEEVARRKPGFGFQMME